MSTEVASAVASFRAYLSLVVFFIVLSRCNEFGSDDSAVRYIDKLE